MCEEFLCEVVPKNLSSVWECYCPLSNPFQSTCVESRNPFSTPTLALASLSLIPCPFHRAAAEESNRPRLRDSRSCSPAGRSFQEAEATASGSFIISGVGTF